ncbi:MAG: hypothetical protein LLF96_12515 [Eubacteriales bacterium]|nr:hypothetical protein [Eubacteriales bacterium]
MQQTLKRSWWQDARLGGVLRYNRNALVRTVILALLILLAAQVIAFLAPLVIDITYTSNGVSVDFSTTIVVALICGLATAHKSTRFLLRFGTARFPVWLGNMASLMIGMTVFLLGTLLLSMLMSGLTLAMANTMPSKYVFEQDLAGVTGGHLFTDSLLAALRDLPTYILYTLEWTAFFYLLGCCLRRNRGLTIFVVVGVPLMLMILTLIPAVRQAVHVVENANERQMMLLGVQWMKNLADVMQFVRREWPTIQLASALVSLPLSYLCMRETPQP